MSTRLPCLAWVAVLGAASAQNYPVLLSEPASPISMDGMETRSLVPGDFDNDGDMDLFAANFGQNSVVYSNDGFGNFIALPPFSLNSTPQYSYDAAWGDMDNDGDLDLAVANGSLNPPPTGPGTPNEIFRNLGPRPGGTTGRFQKVTTGPIPVTNNETFAVAWIDTEGDGDLDLIFVNRLSTNVMYLNDGAGNFTNVATGPFVTDPGTSRDVAVGDLDNDGDTDIVVANSENELNFIYINQGGLQGGTEGDFLRLTNDPAADDTGETYGVSLADYDKDGDLDLFVSRRFWQGNMLYRNNGLAQFERMIALAPSLDASDCYRSAWGDLDRDGDLDLLVANRVADNFFYINNGNGTFTPITYGDIPNMGGNSRDVSVADLDEDSFPEVLFANTLGGDDFIYRNRGRTWKDMGFAYYPTSATPRLTGSGTLAPSTMATYDVVTGPSATSGFLVAGLNTLFAPFKGGTMVPTPDIVIPGLQTTGAGTLNFTIMFPSGVPSGLNLFHQMWFTVPASPTGFISSNGLSALTP